MPIIEKIHAWGHKNVFCTHKSTIEITKEADLSKRGDCVLAVKASKACFDLSPTLKYQIKNGDKFKIVLTVDGIQDHFYGFGNKELNLSDKYDMVFRRSDFICERTVLINCSKSAIELSRELVSKLKNPTKKLVIMFEADE